VREKDPNAARDAQIARIAARQHGVISGEQLEDLGVGRQSLTRRVQAGRLHRIHRRVFAVGHRGLSRAGRWLAAVLACGPGAALSHLSAGWLWGMLRERRHRSGDSDANGPDKGISHVTVPSERKSRRGIRTHRSRTLGPDQVTRKLEIPVTTPTRTLADLRRTLPQPQFAAALRQAEFLRLALDRDLGADGTRSELEARFLGICRRHRLPKPEVNARAGSFIVDFLWPVPRLIVELDGYEAHGGRAAFEADRARDVELRLLGYEVVRFTWRQLRDDPAGVAGALRELLRK
jgi:very-short-patch-repair endonuclease